ncbi:ABC transporter substrate-binding protein [Ramlibacter rhizophilus]|uniref:ABC transporter substrate-binding protein n=1 Tax=Ramlibacter rhizophilus TaxID=1781167 RepID=A0A4Z0BN53_9BURK|nr:ABC transporter substrate-binding protein [Ramlibacter rhizophilus]TFY99853.1 ABC transporter substrate-binding protein [Ramlibacter rhizophilus]
MSNYLQRIGAASFAVALGMGSAVAQNTPQATGRLSNDVLRIGVLTDISGVYADISGKGAIEAVKMAVEDFGGTMFGKPIDVVSADHQNKADIGAAKAREWYDVGGVDMINDLANSGVALAVAGIAKEKKRHAIVNNASNVGITNAQCSPYTVHYAYDAYSLANGTGRAVVENGGDSWFFLTVDFAFGHGLEQQVSEVVKKANGKVLGAARHPLGTSDFASYMLQAQSSKAKIVGLASTGQDTINAIKAAHEFGLTKNQKLAALLLWINDVHSLGLPVAQGLQLTNAWYWDMNEESRKFARRFQERVGYMPNMAHAGDYSSTLHYLKAVQAAGSDDADAVSAKMRSMPIKDMFTQNGTIRADGRMVHDMYLWEVKKPSESKHPWDYLKLVKTIPAAQAFMPLEQSTCPLVKKSS